MDSIADTVITPSVFKLGEGIRSMKKSCFNEPVALLSVEVQLRHEPHKRKHLLRYLGPSFPGSDRHVSQIHHKLLNRLLASFGEDLRLYVHLLWLYCTLNERAPSPVATTSIQARWRHKDINTQQSVF